MNVDHGTDPEFGQSDLDLIRLIWEIERNKTRVSRGCLKSQTGEDYRGGADYTRHGMYISLLVRKDYLSQVTFLANYRPYMSKSAPLIG